MFIANGLGLVYAQSQERTIAGAQQGLQELSRLSDIQDHWYIITTTIDRLLQARQIRPGDEKLFERLSAFEQQIRALQSQPPGLSEKTKSSHQSSINGVVSTGDELISRINLMIEYVRAGQWEEANHLRETELISTQSRFIDHLSTLKSDIRLETLAIVKDASDWQARFQLLWILGVFSLVIIGIILSYLTNRAIISPLHRLVARIERVKRGDLATFKPFRRRDEIGVLSYAISLLIDWLREARSQLDERVKDRTVELEHRSTQLQSAMEIVQAASAQPDLAALMNRVAELLSEQFHYYLVGLFLYDPQTGFASLQAATNEIGRQLVADHYQIAVDSKENEFSPGDNANPVCLAITTGQPQINYYSDEKVIHSTPPQFLPTRAQLDLPLITSRRVIGVLDIHNDKGSTFDPTEISVLQAVSNQISISIENIRLISELRQAIHALEVAQSQYTRTSWQKVSQSGQAISGYRYDATGLKPAPAFHPEAHQAWETGNLVSGHDDSKSEHTQPKTVLAVPIKLRNEIIGVIDIHFHGEHLSPATISLISEVSNRLALMLENARLLREAQRLAGQERQINLIAGRIQSSLNLSQILQDTLAGLAQSLGAKRGWIRLGLGQPGKVSQADPEWLEHLSGLVYQYGENGMSAAEFEVPSQWIEGLRSGNIQIQQSEAPSITAQIWAPLTLRGQVLGLIGLEDLSVNRIWSDDEIQMVTTVANQAAQAVENARLLSETQQLATREQLVGEVTARVRQSLDVETVLRTAAQEIRKVLSLPEVVIRLGPPHLPIEPESQL
jgi:GAF domain-containing protein/HAMP domain-containing protein